MTKFTNQDYIKAGLILALAVLAMWGVAIFFALSNVERVERTKPVGVVQSTKTIYLDATELPVQKSVNHWQGELLQHSGNNKVFKIQLGEGNL